MIKSLNAASSQVWAVILVLLALLTFGIACFCRMPDVRSALLGGGTTLIGAGVMAFQHQMASQKTNDPSPAVDPVAPRPTFPSA